MIHLVLGLLADLADGSFLPTPRPKQSDEVERADIFAAFDLSPGTILEVLPGSPPSPAHRSTHLPRQPSL